MIFQLFQLRGRLKTLGEVCEKFQQVAINQATAQNKRHKKIKFRFFQTALKIMGFMAIQKHPRLQNQL